MTINDMELLRQYAQCKSEEAFASLVSRHVNLVYSVALRQVRDPHLAEEVTQNVFIILARKAASLHDRTIISGWLCRTARHASAKALTMQRRRQHREQEAYVQSHLNETESDAWTQIAPLLDVAMAQLPAKDHDAVALRFLEGRDFKGVSTALGISEAAAKMRVHRALEKLRAFFTKREVTLSAALIAGALSANAVQAAPVGLAASITSAVVKGTAVTAPTSILIQTILKLMAWTKLKTAAVASAVVILAVGIATVAPNRAKVLAQSTPLAFASNATLKTSPKGVAQPTPLSFAGYATPEATLQSLIWASSVGDLEKCEAGLSPDQQARFRHNMARKSDDQKKRDAAAWASSYASYKITQKDIISEDEVHLHITSPLSPDGRRGGDEILIMKKIGDAWKQAGRR